MITEGHIKPDHPLGSALQLLADSANVIIEIGTGSGTGSTQCLINGMHKGARFYTVEGDDIQCVAARKAVYSNPDNAGIAKDVQILHGVLSRAITPYWHPIDRVQDRECWSHEWWVSQFSPIRVITEPEIDLLFLDGGEFTSLGDFLLLWHRAKVIVLDDCNKAVANKNWFARQLLMQSKDWVCKRDEPLDRNGWCIFERR